MAPPVLVFNAVQHVLIAVSRSLSRRGIPVTFADITGTARHPSSRAIQNFVRLPSYREEPDRFLGALAKLIREGGYDMLFPCSDPGLAAVTEHYDRFVSLIYVGCPPPHIVRRVLDKSRTLKAATASGILIPLTYDVPDLATLDKFRDELRLPMIAKPLSKEDETLHTFKMRYFATFQDLRNAFLADPQFGAQNLLQEYCVGEGVGIEVLLHKNEPLALFQHRRMKELPLTGGASVTSVSEPLDPKLVEQAITLLRKLDWEGVAMVEFRYDRLAGRAVLMEVNGRYWGSLPLAIRAGIDFPFYEWQLAHDERVSVPASYRTGLRFRWLSGDLRRLASLFTESPNDGFPRPSKWTESVRFVTDFVAPTCPAIWSWRDPLPAVNDLVDAGRWISGPFLKRTARPVRHAIREYRYLGWRNTIVLLSLRTLAALGLKRDLPPQDLSGIRSVVFVCHGNIIRSPMAEALLRKYLAGSNCHSRISVCSAGLVDEPKGRADERARIVAKEFGVSLDDHRPQRLSPELIERADVIFLMDRINEARIRVSNPAAAKKAFYLGAYTSGHRRVEIPDPNLGTLADVRFCYHTLDLHARRLADSIQHSQTEKPPFLSAYGDAT